jgi:hypothetical protein
MLSIPTSPSNVMLSVVDIDTIAGSSMSSALTQLSESFPISLFPSVVTQAHARLPYNVTSITTGHLGLLHHIDLPIASPPSPQPSPIASRRDGFCDPVALPFHSVCIIISQLSARQGCLYYIITIVYAAASLLALRTPLGDLILARAQELIILLVVTRSLRPTSVHCLIPNATTVPLYRIPFLLAPF